jgi:hypothetical protein
VKAVSGLLGFYALIVTLFVSFIFMKTSPITFFLILIVLAISSSLLEPLINTLVSSTNRAPEISTIVLSFNYIGGGIGYALSSLMLRF